MATDSSASEENLPIVLVVDENPEAEEQFQDPVIQSVVDTCGFTLMFSTSGKMAQQDLEAPDLHVQVVLLSQSLKDSQPAAFVRFLNTKRLNPAIYLVDAAALTQSAQIPPEMKQLGVKGWYPRPYDATRLNEILKLNKRAISAAAPTSGAAGGGAAASDEISLDDGDYVTVKPNGIVVGVKSFFDVYIRLGDGKYVRLIAAGDKPTAEQVTKYTSRGVKFFHIRKEIQESYVKYCQQVASLLLNSKKINQEAKLGGVLNQGQEAYGLMKSQGVSDENVEYAGNFVLNMAKAVKDYNLVQNDALSRFLSKVSSYEHNTRVAAMSGMLARTLKLESDRSASIIGMAGLLHDVGLLKLGMEEGIGEFEGRMHEEEQAKYLTHPEVGARVLAQLKHFSPTIIQAVQQHHVRRDGTGFPSAQNFASINVCSEIIGIVDRYDYLIRQRMKDPNVNLRALMEASFQGFTKQVVQAFKDTFWVGAKRR